MGSMQKVKCVCFCGFELVTSSVHVDFLRSKIRFKISVEATLYKDRLYVSYFSLTGGFKIDVFDGGVAEVNPNTEDPPVPIISDLWKPHSPRFFDNKSVFR